MKLQNTTPLALRAMARTSTFAERRWRINKAKSTIPVWIVRFYNLYPSVPQSSESPDRNFSQTAVNSVYKITRLVNFVCHTLLSYTQLRRFRILLQKSKDLSHWDNFCDSLSRYFVLISNTHLWSFMIWFDKVHVFFKGHMIEK